MSRARRRRVGKTTWSKESFEAQADELWEASDLKSEQDVL